MESELFQTQISALENKLFDYLYIIRDREECFLVIQLNGTNSVLTGRQGFRKSFRHAWQIKKWLKENYSIDENQIGYKKIYREE